VSVIVLINLLDPESVTPVVALTNDIAAILFSQPYSVPKQRQTIELDAAIYDSYVGQYELEPGWVMTVTREGNQLFTQWSGLGRAELFPESSTKFFMKLVDSQRTFLVDEMGEATQVIVHNGGRDRVAKRVG
jgi:Domain of unknown function (DUF3471)